MKNIVLCFDRARNHPGPRDATNAESLLHLLDESDEQITWYHPGTRVPSSDGRTLARLPGACWPLADIALDWMLDGAVQAGVTMRDASHGEAPTPSEYDALAGSALTISLRRLPPSPLVHASVDIYLRAHPEYWRRLPAHVVWADTDWLARSERLVHAESLTAPVEPEVFAAAAS